MAALEEHEAVALEVRLSARKLLRPLKLLVAFLSYYVLGGVTGFIDARLAVVGVAFFGTIIASGLWMVSRARGAPWELQLDEGGLTVRGHDRIPWSDLERCE